MCYCPTPTLHLNLALTGDGAFLFSLKKTHSVWFISVLNYGDTENVLINPLLLVIPVSYPCHYTNLCPHKPHKHAHTHTHTYVCLFSFGIHLRDIMSLFCRTLWKSMVPQNSLVTNFLTLKVRISYFVFGRTKTFIQVWNYLRVNDDRMFFFGWTIPLKSECFDRLCWWTIISLLKDDGIHRESILKNV